MAEFHVSIYIETSVRGPAVRPAAGEWIAEYVTSKGIPVTRSNVLWKPETTENALALELLEEALSSLGKT